AIGPSPTDATVADLAEVDRFTAGAAGLPPSTRLPAAHSAWNYYLVGRTMLANGDVPAACNELAAAVKLDPAGRWPNFHYGVATYRAGRYQDAVVAYSVAIGSSSKVAAFFYHRALAYSALGEVGE